ncbi:MAG: hypothetical protein ACLUN0_07280 [Roseburia sp.]
MGTSYNAITAKGEGIITILVIIMLGLAVCFDLWKSKIPNWLTGMGVMTGYAAHIRGEGEKGIYTGNSNDVNSRDSILFIILDACNGSRRH